MILHDVSAYGTQHCETSALGVLLRHQGLDLSEPMLFGLGAGLGFVYWDSKAMDFPFLGGRVRPFELTKNLTARLGLRLDVTETSSERKAWQQVARALDSGRPVGLQLDSAELEYFGSGQRFGGHVVAMYGYDDEQAFLVDTEQQGGAVTTSLRSLARARAARGPMTARNRTFTITVPDRRIDLMPLVGPAVRACAESFLNPPIANLGYRGIAKAAKLVPGWPRRSTDPARDLPLTAMLMERAGTGGALFRNLYRDFLTECQRYLDDAALREGQRTYAEAARLWSEVAESIAAGGDGDDAPLQHAGHLLTELSSLEQHAMRTLATVTG